MNYFVKKELSATRAVCFLLCAFLILLCAGISAKPARALTFSYIGPAWDIGECEYDFEVSAPPCTSGSLTGSITFSGISGSYSGHVYPGSIASWSFNGSGVASLGTGDWFSAATDIYITSGQISAWDIAAYQDSSYDAPAIKTFSGGYGGDAAWTYGVTLAGDVDYLNGLWFNAKALGDPQCACGDPIDLGTGNVFETVTDYTTVGQNPLSF